MKTTVRVHTDVVRSARVVQVEGVFDVPKASSVDLAWDVDLPIEQREWSIGALIGPSGCGKSTVMNACWADEVRWSKGIEERLRVSTGSLLDAFPAGMPIKEIIGYLSAVGFSSPPAWVRPFKVLSNGEQFRVTMAALLAYAHAEKRTAPVVVDEFTSVVDRTVARIGSAAIAKAVRRNNQKLVVVTCHEDVEAWLQPEWVYRPAEQSFAWRSVQPRPRVALSIYRVPHGLWSRFRNHHYLTHELNKSAFCFAAVGDFGDDTGPRLVAFDAWLPFFGKLSHGQGRRGHRTVCLPDYQGIGIGNALFSTLASMWAGLGFRAFSGTAHPAEIAARRRNPSWKMTQAPMMRAKGAHTIDAKRASDRLMASFEWQGPAMDKKQATRLLNNWKTDL